MDKTDTAFLPEPGRNCWRVAAASRATVIVDAEEYFRVARAAMLTARRQILLIGWDFDARIRFKESNCNDDGPEQVGAFVSWLTKRTPGLQVYILRWDTGAIKSLFHARTLLRIMKWTRDEQVHLRLDAYHPFGGSHHQKILVIDDELAFCGGIDVTEARWDTREHRDDDPRRVDSGGKPYVPWHDATTMLQGPIAKALGDLGRERWRTSGGTIEAPEAYADERWPADVRPDFTDIQVGIARTVPEMDGQHAAHEIETLYLDLIARARRWIYAESQYFASRKVAEAIARRLEEPDGPEIVIVHPDTADGWLQPIAMDSARARLVAALKERDPHDRLRLYHPFTAAGEPIYVHAKVMVVDDDVLRVGSSNLNNRSMRLDTECDMVIAAAAGDDAARLAIAGIRNALLAEHLGSDCASIEALLAETGSVIAVVERLRGSGRTLRPYEVEDIDGVRGWLADNKILDPEGPGEMFEAVSKRTDLLHRLGRHRRWRHETDGIDPWFVGGIAAGAMTAVAGSIALLRRRRH